MRMTPQQRAKEGQLQKALSSSPIDKQLINKGRRLDLEARVNKEMADQKYKSRGTQSSSVRREMK